MKKDYFWITVLGLIILSYVLDQISSPISVRLRNPYAFITQVNLSTYPLSAVSIAAKAIALATSLILAFSYLKISPFIKAIVLFFLASLGQLYAIQQLATNGKLTPITWTLGVAFAGVISIMPIIIYLIQGLFSSAQKAIVKELKPQQSDLKSYSPDKL